MRIAIRLQIAAFVLFVSAATTFGDIPIRFAKGRTSATVSGKIAAGGRVCYFAGARRGQTLTADVSSRSGKVQIVESGDTRYSYVIEIGGDQSVCVDNLARATTYTLSVSIK